MGFDIERIADFFAALSRWGFWLLFLAYPVMMFNFIGMKQGGNLLELAGALLYGIVPFFLLYMAKFKSEPFVRPVATTIWGVLALIASGLVNTGFEARTLFVILTVVLVATTWLRRDKGVPTTPRRPTTPHTKPTPRPATPKPPEHNWQWRSVGKGRVMGQAGGNISQSDFGAAAVQAGTKGEERVGSVLNEAAERYGATVWHGIHFSPGSNSRADVDHAVAVNEFEIWLIDAKMWAYGTYRWNRDGTVWRDGGPFKGGEVHMQDAHDKWVQYLRTYGVTVRTFICMANVNSKRYVIEGDPQFMDVTLCTVDELRSMLAVNTRPHGHLTWMSRVSSQKLS